jgi:purine-binding chemotaxis protein CheW
VSKANDELRELVARGPSEEDDDEAKTARVKVLLLRAGERWFGIDPHRVHEVVVRGAVTRVPTAPAHVLGLSIARGRLVPAISLQDFLGYRGEGAPAQTLPRLVIVRAGELEAGIICDETRGIVDLSHRDVGATAGARPESISAELEWEKGILFLLDLDRFLRTALGQESGT